MPKRDMTKSIIGKITSYCQRNTLKSERFGPKSILITAPTTTHPVLHLFVEERPGWLTMASVAFKPVPASRRPGVETLLRKPNPLNVDRVRLLVGGYPIYRRDVKISATRLTGKMIDELCVRAMSRLNELTQLTPRKPLDNRNAGRPPAL